MLPAILAAGATLAGALINKRSQQKAGDANADLQREFAQNGVRWKIADAKAAGIHPVAAMGMQPIQASPSYVGDTSMGEGIAQSGQDISRAINATSTARERGDRLGEFIEQKVQAQNIRDAALRHENREDLRLKSQLANDEVQRMYYAAQIAKLQAAPNPPMPGTVSSSTGSRARVAPSVAQNPGVKYNPDEVTRSAPGRKDLTAGQHPAFTRHVSPFGFDIVSPSKNFSESLEGTGELGGLLFGTVPSLGLSGWEAAKAAGSWASRNYNDFRKWGTPASKRGQQ